MAMLYRSFWAGAPPQGAGVGRRPRDILLRIRRFLASSALLTCLTSGACGGGDGGNGGNGGTTARPVLPQVVDVGGTFLASPKVLPILYSSDAAAADILAFLQE